MAHEHVKFTFPGDLANQPLIYNMGKQFRVVTNIRRADLSRDRGWVILEIEGDPEDVARSLEWARGQGVRVEPIAPSRPGASERETGEEAP